MMIRTLALVMAFAGLSNPCMAQDASSLHDDQLIASVAKATEAQDAARLLSLMREARTRGLLMFQTDAQACEPAMPDTDLLANLISRGTAQWAYITQARMTAMDRGECGCPYSLLSFDDFSQHTTGSAAVDLTTDDLPVLQQFRATNERSVNADWHKFRQSQCGD